MSALPSAPERAAIKSSDRITIGKDVRLVWRGVAEQGSQVTFELRERGYVRVLAGDVLRDKLEAAKAAKDASIEQRLALVLIPGRFEDSHRLPLPQLVIDRVFGANAKPTSIVLRGTERFIELWSDERWEAEVDAVLRDGADYWST